MQPNQRTGRKFLVATTAASTLAISAFGVQAEAPNRLALIKPLTVKAGEARFGIHTPFRGIIKDHNNDLIRQM